MGKALLLCDRTQVLGYNRSVSAKAASAVKGAESRKNYLKNVKPGLPKVAKADNSALAETLEVRTVFGSGIVPKGAALENVRVIAGHGTSETLRVASRLAGVYGGEDYKWSKRTGTVYSENYVYEVHWYERDATQYRQKLKGMMSK